MLLYFLLFQFLMQMHIQKNPFKTLFCLFEHSNQPDNSLTNSVGLEWGYLMSQPIAEREIKNSIFAIPFEMTHFSFK